MFKKLFIHYSYVWSKHYFTNSLSTPSKAEKESIVTYTISKTLSLKGYFNKYFTYSKITNKIFKI